MALNSLYCADVPLSSYSLTHSPTHSSWVTFCIILLTNKQTNKLTNADDYMAQVIKQKRTVEIAATYSNYCRRLLAANYFLPHKKTRTCLNAVGCFFLLIFFPSLYCNTLSFKNKKGALFETHCIVCLAALCSFSAFPLKCLFFLCMSTWTLEIRIK